MNNSRHKQRAYTEERIPESTLETLKRYINHRIPPGSFLEAVLSNDLFEAFARADVHNRQAMHHIVDWLYNYVPSASHGSREAYREWLRGEVCKGYYIGKHDGEQDV